MNVQDAADVAHKAANVATYGGSGTALYFGFSPGEWQAIGILGGLVFAAAGYFTNLWFKAAHLKLEREREAKGNG